jgi:transposase InsO family protein
VELASAENANRRELCRRFGVTPKTGYKWLERHDRGEELRDRSRRPRSSPTKTREDIEELVVSLRDEHPAWGGRKLHRYLLDRGHSDVPVPSTITEILRRKGRLNSPSRRQRDWQRFEYALPNALWQMDFKGHFPLLRGRCHPLTILDDHSRFSIALEACPNEKGLTVQERLTACFRRYGMPVGILTDNGSPWGSGGEHGHSPLTVWLLRLGVQVNHGRPYHPQTQGKDERFHRTLKAEVLTNRTFEDIPACQRTFERWRQVYNLERPHEALSLATPASRYTVSPRPFPEVLPPIEYQTGDIVRKVQLDGDIFLHGRRHRVPRAFRGHPVALRPTSEDGEYAVFFCHQQVATIDLRA